jgi:hypothetical protein
MPKNACDRAASSGEYGRERSMRTTCSDRAVALSKYPVR